jgi:hypothetical protein
VNSRELEILLRHSAELESSERTFRLLWDSLGRETYRLRVTIADHFGMNAVVPDDGVDPRQPEANNLVRFLLKHLKEQWDVLESVAAWRTVERLTYWVGGLEQVHRHYTRVWSTLQEARQRRRRLSQTLARYRKSRQIARERHRRRSPAEGPLPFRIYRYDEALVLSDKQLASLVREAVRVLGAINVERQTLQARNKHPTSPNPDRGQLAEPELKRFARALAELLCRHHDLREFTHQLAVESSRGASLEAIQLGLTMKTIVDWSTGLIQEVTEDTPNAVYRIAHWAVSYRGARLQTAEVGHLQEAFGADAGILEQLQVKDLTAIEQSQSYRWLAQVDNIESLSVELADTLASYRQRLADALV